ncbi:hypothetical protein JTZ62_04305 [Mammaliicoccus sciuri]|uniref:hypothetical protein n=1 Tax=Mammaliicoccus sciuri TaxID=1296 RepID=UPI0019D32AA1|nr:hypothetical protein [Mammaliicoccus sciuri]MEB6232636.1 hypothetical protein [Mammaliicoccus sciuri]QSN68384.1 hypothetical protein JTZ62_04305 [Mammaliicoccus sciuri]UIU23122.1 hypothetical protein LLZ87_04315 [Mammaliicoccus sciuri]UIU26027.1 hypothetical protein LLZ92_04315 [Mammaliicoccus sciuri]
MYKYNLAITGEQNLSEEEVYNLLQDRISDGVICVRTVDGNSTILKGEVKIKLIKTSEQLNYK